MFCLLPRELPGEGETYCLWHPMPIAAHRRFLRTLLSGYPRLRPRKLFSSFLFLRVPIRTSPYPDPTSFRGAGDTRFESDGETMRDAFVTPGNCKYSSCEGKGDDCGKVKEFAFGTVWCNKIDTWQYLYHFSYRWRECFRYLCTSCFFVKRSIVVFGVFSAYSYIWEGTICKWNNRCRNIPTDSAIMDSIAEGCA